MKFNNMNVFISPKADIGKNVKVGDGSIIYDNVQIGDNSIICNNCVLGEPVNEYYSNEGYTNPDTIIGPNALIRSHTIIYADSSFGEYFSTGHRVTIREGTRMGSHCSVGTLSDIQGSTSFGNYCRMHSNIFIGSNSKICNFVFIYPYVVFTNDPTPPSNICVGPEVDNFTQIAAGAILLPGIKISRNCLIAAGAIVTKDVEEYSVIAGNPGKLIGDIREIRSRELHGSHYPWMYNFSRGMPWADIGYEHWIKKQSDEDEAQDKKY